MVSHKVVLYIKNRLYPFIGIVYVLFCWVIFLDFNFFLWPMILPMIVPLFYSIRYRRDSLKEIIGILIIMITIIIVYWPLLTSEYLSSATYVATKILLFLVIPCGILLLLRRSSISSLLPRIGLQKKGIRHSFVLGILFLPLMLIVTFLLHFVNGVGFDPNVLSGSVSFFEAFTEEFFFRGILFLYLFMLTDLRIAYFTSLACFILAHPQQVTSLFILGTLVQGILTLEITRKSENIIGAWMVHGINRFFILAVLPFIL